jgi:hypothetical protein
VPLEGEDLDRALPDDLAVEALVDFDSLDERGWHAVHVLHRLAQLVDRHVVIHGEHRSRCRTRRSASRILNLYQYPQAQAHNVTARHSRELC